MKNVNKKNELNNGIVLINNKRKNVHNKNTSSKNMHNNTTDKKERNRQRYLNQQKKELIK